MNELIERTIGFLGMRKHAYKLTFQKNSNNAQIVLKDLMMFAHVNEDCPHTDPFMIGKWLGRQEVALRLSRHLCLTPEELFAIYSGVRTQHKEN